MSSYSCRWTSISLPFDSLRPRASRGEHAESRLLNFISSHLLFFLHLPTSAFPLLISTFPLPHSDFPLPISNFRFRINPQSAIQNPQSRASVFCPKQGRRTCFSRPFLNLRPERPGLNSVPTLVCSVGIVR